MHAYGNTIQSTKNSRISAYFGVKHIACFISACDILPKYIAKIDFGVDFFSHLKGVKSWYIVFKKLLLVAQNVVKT